MKAIMPLWLTLVVVLAACSCTRRERSPVPKSDHAGCVGVAAISGDRELANRLVGVLAAAGITSAFEGSIVYSISVPADKHAQAAAILKKDAQTHKYWIEVLPK